MVVKDVLIFYTVSLAKKTSHVFYITLVVLYLPIKKAFNTKGDADILLFEVDLLL